MAASMRDSPLDGGHRGKVADPNNKTTHSAAAAPASTTAAGAVVSASNFEYDDNEWDIGIGNLIIDLDADIEKTNEKGGVGAAGTVGVGVVPPQQPQQAANNNTINNNNNFHSNSMASTGTGASGGAKGKMSAAAAVEHSATVDKGLKMKIKRTKPGTKEAKHEIVKAPVQDGATGATTVNNASSIVAQNGDSVECAKVGAGSKHPGGTGGSKRGSSGHRRDKARDKHADKQQQQQQPALAKTADVNGVLPATPASVVSGAGGVTGPPTAAVAPTSAQQQLPATPTVAAAPGPTPPLPVCSQPQVTPPSPASQVQSVPLQPTVPSSAVVQQQQASPVTPAAPPQSVLQQPPAAAADLPPQATTLLVFPGAGPTAPGVCVSVTGGNTNKSLALQQQPPSDPPSAKPSAVKQQAGLEDTGPTCAGSTSPPPSKKLKTGPLVNCVGSAATAASCALTTNGPSSCGDPKQSDVTDVCVGTSVGTITEPDCLGPCEPGTSVTLEGIVWHETEGGVLVVNVTWRGKTYVGTLLDCTKHDWAPPRFCDSPTSDLDARTPKGRGKRGRAAAATPANDLSNFTETRSSVHSKLRNGAKGRRGAAGSPAPPTVPPFVTPKPDNNSKRKGRASETEEPPAPTGVGNGGGGKRSRSGSRGPTISPPVSPVLLECPEPNCSKKYKHINGLKYHQSHAHGGGEEDSLLDSKDAISLSENDESNAEPPSVPPSPSPEKCSPLPKSEVRKEETPALEQLPAVPPQASSPSQTPLALPSSVPPAEVVSADKNLVKPGVLRFGPTEDSPSIPPASHFPVGVYCNSKTSVSSPSSLTNIRAVTLTAPTTSPVINIPQPPSVKLLPSSQSAVQQPSPLPQSQQQSLSQIPQSPQPIPTSVTPPSTAQPQDMAGNKLCDKYKVKIPPAPQRPAAVQGLAVSPLKAVQPSKTVPLIPELGDKKDKSKVGVVLQGSPQQPQPPPQTQPQQLTIPLQQQQQQQQQLVNKKKNRKSPASSPQPDSLHNGAMIYGMESSPLALPTPNEGREDVQSPAYSDISDDGAPVLESEVGDKGQAKLDKKVESQPQHNLGHYGIYPFYGQPPYLVPSVPSNTVVPSDKGKDAEKGDSSKPLDRSMDKDKKDMPGSVTSPADFQQKLLQQQQAPPPQPQQAHYFPYGYVPGYPYNLDSYPMSVMTEKYMQEPQEPLERPKSLSEKDKIKDIKEEKISGSNMDSQSAKNASMSMKDRPIKSEPSNLKEKQNENHQILKESIEMKSQMNDKSKFSSYDANQYLYRQQQEDLRRYYLYPEQQAQAAQAAAVAARRKEPPAQPLDATVSKDKGGSKSSSTLGSPKVSGHKDKSEEKQSEKKEQDKASKQEGVKPTMETQGPPPPTSSYAYIHPGYMQSPHYPFDPNVYRAMSPMIVNPYGGNPYLHPQMRYHGPEDLSRGPPAAPPKALDMLQHHASQYYSSHKIHELQERALKSPTPKSTSTPQPAPPSTVSGPPSSGAVGSSGSTGPSGPPAAPGPPTGKPPSSADGKDAPAPLRSPPPQRHVHTHHHTHVGLGYPLLPPGQYPAPYGAVLASQQAAAVAASVISPYPPTTPSK